MKTLFNKTRVKSTNFYFDQRCKVITLPRREDNNLSILKIRLERSTDSKFKVLS